MKHLFVLTAVLLLSAELLGQQNQTDGIQEPQTYQGSLDCIARLDVPGALYELGVILKDIPNTDIGSNAMVAKGLLLCGVTSAALTQEKHLFDLFVACSKLPLLNMREINREDEWGG